MSPLVPFVSNANARPGDHRGVAILGRAGSGKTTLADELVRQGTVRERVSFAAALKDDLAKLGIVKGDPGFREVAQAYGTDFARAKYGPDYWPNRLRKALGGSLEGVAIDDLRFPSELALCKGEELLVVRINVSAAVRSQRLGYACPEHASESSLDDAEVDLELDGEKWGPKHLAELVAFKLRVTRLRAAA